MKPEIIGPTNNPHFKNLKQHLRIINRDTTAPDSYKFPGKEHEFTESTEVILFIQGNDPEILEKLGVYALVLLEGK